MAETKRMTSEQVVGYLLEGEGLDFVRESLSWVVRQLMEVSHTGADVHRVRLRRPGRHRGCVCREDREPDRVRSPAVADRDDRGRPVKRDVRLPREPKLDTVSGDVPRQNPGARGFPPPPG
jgi:hypothetical protein